MNLPLSVFREYRGIYQRVGSLLFDNEEVSFSYVSEYLSSATAQSISLTLPLQEEIFSPAITRTFFEGLLPEGELRKLLTEILRADGNTYTKILSRLNNESVGALVFCADTSEPTEERDYVAFEAKELQEFVQQPLKVALDAALASRLSLAGAQTKLGLYHRGDDPLDGWFLPKGLAPSTHIVKAPSEVFPFQTVNEALCLLTAHFCGFQTASVFLIPFEDSEPLLAVERFDRITSDGPPIIRDLAVPLRLHQEDFCQAAGLPSHMKYEPTEGHYLSLVGSIINRSVVYPIEDRIVFLRRIFFDYLIGNCDNHLKNYSLLWSEDWASCALAPLYDVTCTTFYPQHAREMGISLCDSRRIDGVDGEDIVRAARKMGLPETIAQAQYRDVCEQFPHALAKAQKNLLGQGYESVSTIADFIVKDSERRINLI